MKRILPVEDSTTGTLPMSVRVPPRLRDAIATAAGEKGMGVSEWFRMLAERELKAVAKKAKRRPGGRR